MSAYRDYVTDFPCRCSELLMKLRSPARSIGLEVTHLLSVTMAGLIIPHARLKEEIRIPHPSGDRLRYRTAASEYDELLEKRFLSPPLWLDGGSTWRKGRVKDFRAQAPNFDEAFASAKRMRSNDKVKTVVTIMRNALAHGNIVTGGPEINDIMFLSANRNSAFRFVAVEPQDLHKFMMNYFKFLSHLDLSEGTLVGGEPEAA